MVAVIAAASFSSIVADGPLLFAVGVAALVGLVGFLSPCVLPLVPGYLSYMAGVSGDAGRPSQRRMVGAALLFAAGFTVVLVLTADVLFVGLGRHLAEHRGGIERALGVVTIVLGVVFLGGLRPMQREVRLRRLPAAGLLGAPVLGATFGLAWTPCLTPTFSAVVGLASTESTAARGAVLTMAYCLGLSIPFVLIASGFAWATAAVQLLRRHVTVMHRIGGGLLITLGVLLVTGEWTHLMNSLRAWAGPTGIGSGL
jgi:cytochrome c-type biogenesis protein